MSDERMTPEQHFERAQDMIAKLERRRDDGVSMLWMQVQAEVAHLHLRAAEVGGSAEFRALRRARFRESARENQANHDDRPDEFVPTR